MEENSGGFERNGTKNEAFIPKNETPNGVVKCGSFSGYELESHLLSKVRLFRVPFCLMGSISKWNTIKTFSRYLWF